MADPRRIAMMRPLLALGIVVSTTVSASAGAGPALCEQTSSRTIRDPLLAEATAAVYPGRHERPAFAQAACVYPFKAIAHGTSVVLLTLSQTPGGDCHGCEATISADFLSRRGDVLVPVARHRAFARAGSSGDLTAVTPVRLGTEQAMVVEAGGSFQGITFGVIQPFVIRDGRMTRLGPRAGILTSVDDCGTGDPDEPCLPVTATWTVDGTGRFLVTYAGIGDGHANPDATVVYERRANALVVTHGAALAAKVEDRRP
jgi:hypothetical protein